MSLIPLGILAASGAGGATAFESIATATGTGSSGTITFSSIPSTYQHLQIRGLMRNTDTGSTGQANVLMTFNSDTGSNYTRHLIYGDGGGTGVFTSTSATNIQLTFVGAYDGDTANVFGGSIVDVLDYKSTTKNKTIKSFSGCDLNNVNGAIVLQSGMWMNTSAITSITLVSGGSTNFKVGTTFALYGIKGA